MPTINENLQRLQTCKSDISSAITTKGGTVSSGDGFEEFPADIATIPTTASIYAFLYLTVDAGATATVSKNGTTLAQTSSAGEELLFEIPSSGTWSISVSKTGETIRTNSIVINEQKDYYLEMPFAHVYGVVWDKTSSVMVRTDDAANFAEPDPYVADGNHPGSSPFDNLYPWNGMIKETINENVMVKIPKFYFKLSNTASDGTGVFKLQISDAPQAGFSLSPAHRDKGYGEKDYVYIGRYHCDGLYRSKKGSTPKCRITRATARSSCASTYNNGHFHQIDFSLWITIWMLYIIEFANWDSQTVIGAGGGTGSVVVTGNSDNMPYHTGTMQSTRSRYAAGVQYRNIEDLWGNVYDWCDGITFKSGNIYTWSSISQYSDDYTSTDAVNVGTSASSSNTKWIHDFAISSNSAYDWFMYPGTNSIGTTQTLICDQYNSGSSVLRVGSTYTYDSPGHGLFRLHSNNTSTSTGDGTGCRLQYIPS